MTSDLADRIRGILSEDPNIAEIRMFGGICFTLNGNMLVGTMKDGTLLARVGESGEPEALAKPGASRVNFTGREMKGYIIVAEDELDDTSLRGWIALATAEVGPMPPKVKKAKSDKPGKK